MGEQGARVTWEAAGEGERRWFVGTLATITVPGEASDGRFALIEFLFPQWASPPLHTHPQDESYVVLEGRLTIQAGDERFELGAGGTALVPMGVPHTFRVDSEGARVLVLSTPAGLERLGQRPVIEFGADKFVALHRQCRLLGQPRRSGGRRRPERQHAFGIVDDLGEVGVVERPGRYVKTQCSERLGDGVRTRLIRRRRRDDDIRHASLAAFA